MSVKNRAKPSRILPKILNFRELRGDFAVSKTVQAGLGKSSPFQGKAKKFMISKNVIQADALFLSVA